jgi:hypothetical protein
MIPPSEKRRPRIAARLRVARLALVALAAVCSAAGLGIGLVRACADGPVGMLPGGRLRGAESREALPVEGAAAQERELELEIDAGHRDWLGPRSVRTWFVAYEGRLHATADFLTPWKRWPYQALAAPAARVRLGGRIHRVRLTRVEAADTVAALRQEVARKYAIEPGSWLAGVEVWFFRLDPPEPLR